MPAGLWNPKVERDYTVLWFAQALQCLYRPPRCGMEWLAYDQYERAMRWAGLPDV